MIIPSLLLLWFLINPFNYCECPFKYKVVSYVIVGTFDVRSQDVQGTPPPDRIETKTSIFYIDKGFCKKSLSEHSGSGISLNLKFVLYSLSIEFLEVIQTFLATTD